MKTLPDPSTLESEWPGLVEAMRANPGMFKEFALDRSPKSPEDATEASAQIDHERSN